MRIIVIGREAFGRASLEALLEQGEQVVGVITVPDVPGARANPVRELAEARSIPCLQPRNLKGNRVYEWVRDLAPDLLVLAYVTEFVPGRLIELARLGGINYHPSLLPKFRGGTAINWAIIYGEKETGVTIHYIDEGVDTGDIILQRRVEIGPDDTSASLYYNKLFPLGVEMIAEAVRLIREGKAPRIRQDEAVASFQPVIKDSDTRIDWAQPAGRVHDLIRGAAPRPGAWTTRGGEKVRVWESALPAAASGGALPGAPGEAPGPAAMAGAPAEAAPAAVPGPAVRAAFPGAAARAAVPGCILEVSADGALVAAGEGVVLLKRLGAEGGPKLPAAEYAAQVGLAPGQRLGD